MAVILTVDTPAWRARIGDLVAAHAAAHLGVLPVVKGNGYGFGRVRLADEVDLLGLAALAVGTVHELLPASKPSGAATQLVLTPVVSAVDAAVLTTVRDAVPTIGSLLHLRVLREAGWHGAVVVKLVSSMRRYGVEADEVTAITDAVAASGLSVHAYALHLPLVSSDRPTAAATGGLAGDGPAAMDAATANQREADGWLARIPQGTTVHLSHLSIDELAGLAAAHPGVRLVHRFGTALWLGGCKDGLHLGAEVVDVRPCRRGDTAGYRSSPVADDGHLVMVGAGTAHGVHPLGGGQSPFHYAHRRLALVEPPHMHTTMVLVPSGDPCPEPGELVDVQRPLTQTFVDRVDG